MKRKHLPLGLAALALLGGAAGCLQVLGLDGYKDAGGTGTDSTSSGMTTSTGTMMTTSSSTSTGMMMACMKDADCSDGLACDGVEHCNDSNLCEPGTPPCPAASDPVHCVTSCTENQGAAVCGMVVARDADGDTHGDPLCAQAPGDDCDDKQAADFPGNTEICDGIDNNCDGAVDEGTSVGGMSVEIGGSDSYANAHTAYSDALALYGTAYILSVQAPELKITEHHHDGTIAQSISIGAFDQEGREDLVPRVAAIDTGFGVVWHDEANPYSDVRFSFIDTQTASAQVTVEDSFQLGGSSPDIVATGANDFIVVWKGENAGGKIIGAQHLMRDGTPIGKSVKVADVNNAGPPRIARSGNKYAVVWVDTDANGSVAAKAQVFDDSLTLGGGGVTLGAASASDIAIATHPEGFVVGYHLPGLGLVVLDTNLQTKHVGGSTRVDGHLSLATTSSEILAVHAPASDLPMGAVELWRYPLDGSTAFQPPFQISEASIIQSRAGISTVLSTAQGIGVTWGNLRVSIDTDETVEFRGMGGNICQ